MHAARILRDELVGERPRLSSAAELDERLDVQRFAFLGERAAGVELASSSTSLERCGRRRGSACHAFASSSVCAGVVGGAIRAVGSR